MSMLDLTKGKIKILIGFVETVNNDSVNGKITPENILTYSQNLIYVAKNLELIISDIEQVIGKDRLELEQYKQALHETNEVMAKYIGIKRDGG